MVKGDRGKLGDVVHRDQGLPGGGQERRRKDLLVQTPLWKCEILHERDWSQEGRTQSFVPSVLLHQEFVCQVLVDRPVVAVGRQQH